MNASWVYVLKLQNEEHKILKNIILVLIMQSLSLFSVILLIFSSDNLSYLCNSQATCFRKHQFLRVAFHDHDSVLYAFTSIQIFHPLFTTSRAEQNVPHFLWNFQMHFLNRTVFVFWFKFYRNLLIIVQYVSIGSDNWRRTGDKSISEPMIAWFSSEYVGQWHRCVNSSWQWIIRNQPDAYL